MAHEDTVESLQQVLQLDRGAPALQFHDRWSTYGELADEIDAARVGLRAAGVEPGSPVATVLPNDPAGLVSLLSVMLERACVLTISPRRPAQDLGAAPPFAAVLGPEADVSNGQAVNGSLGLVVAPGRPGARAGSGAAILMATSGTTGDPKRIPISYATIDGVVGGVRGMANGEVRAPLLRDDTTLICFPYTNLSGVLPQLIALVSGRRTALLERFDPIRVAQLVAEHSMTSLALNPTTMQMLVDADIDPTMLSTVKYARSGSAPLRPDLAEAFEERFGIGVLQSYGQTEVGGEVVGWSAADHRSFGITKRGSVGRPHPGIELRVAARDSGPHRALALGEVGELWLRGARNVQGWHRMGDLARIDVDGFVWIEGRADGVIICGGFNIVPAALERVLDAHPAVRESAVVGRSDDRLGEVPVALVVLERDAAVTPEELMSHARTHLEPFQVPREVVLVDELPRTEIGKVHLPSLRALARCSNR